MQNREYSDKEIGMLDEIVIALISGGNFTNKPAYLYDDAEAILLERTRRMESWTKSGGGKVAVIPQTGTRRRKRAK